MALKSWLFVSFILMWCGFGIYGTQYDNNNFNWGMIVFMVAVPFIPILAYFAGIF